MHMHASFLLLHYVHNIEAGIVTEVNNSLIMQPLISSKSGACRSRFKG